MNIVMRELWVNALRSGKYKQGQFRLRKRGETPESDEYCCLGVLCNVVDPDGWSDAPEYGEEDALTYRFRHADSITSLPTSLANLLELGPSTQGRLIDMNDEGKSFEEIANEIERIVR